MQGLHGSVSCPLVSVLWYQSCNRSISKGGRIRSFFPILTLLCQSQINAAFVLELRHTGSLGSMLFLNRMFSYIELVQIFDNL
jgi:hypothetical protein